MSMEPGNCFYAPPYEVPVDRAGNGFLGRSHLRHFSDARYPRYHPVPVSTAIGDQPPAPRNGHTTRAIGADVFGISSPFQQASNRISPYIVSGDILQAHFDP